ncbi:hypothetical protein LTR97_008607 [Elasticomyces elasticus]|uniref:Rhodopsin domain-containing protein n=1 Tax=Elasticomyces elasticus TaxID=574655 RepID=A0AAN7W221_9PEZI|nr:hypothetical protein LTR97_008607 [Elasticomyces elasticus]
MLPRFANAGFNIATDIITTALPLPMLRALHLPRHQKIALLLVFALGGVTCIISILRLPALYAISKATDVSYSNPLTALYSNLEVNIGILCCSIPPLKAFVARVWPGLFGGVRSEKPREDGGRGPQPKRRFGIASLREIEIVTMPRQELEMGLRWDGGKIRARDEITGWL